MIRRILVVLSVLAIASLACGLGIRPPVLPTAGPTVTEEISIPAPDAGGTPVLQIEFGAGELGIKSGGDQLVSGTARYNLPQFKPTIDQNGAIVTLSQSGNGSPPRLTLKDAVNEWDLELGSMPMNLTISAGAYKAEYDLGGLALTSLTVKDGAAEANLVFSSPNEAEMSSFSYETGASNVTVEQIGNASPATFSFRCGAGNYSLDFSGEWQQDMTGHIEAGLGNLQLVIPEGVPAQITVEGGLSNTTTDGDWEKNGDTYSQSGEGPAIVLIITIGAGNLEIGN
jgi:hypothetical protein